MREKEKSTTIYFIRHGQPKFPTDRIYCDDLEDPDLTGQGKEQARSVVKILANSGLDAIYSSPSLRAKKTAEPLASQLNYSVTYLDTLRERRFGKWEGLYFHEIEEQFGDEYLEWKSNQVEYTPEGGESMNDLFKRLKNGLSQMIATHPGGKIAVFSHVGAIRALVLSAFDIPLNQFRQIRIDYASITTIDYGVSKNNLINLNVVGY
ncbi:MAG: histidine phosphatase family protein [Gammaproteobacteria bacterium]|nr:histidine phosphatase family protein [Gammaproteobacteria bacterium]